MKTRRVYHFCNESHGLQNIEKARLKVATIMDLNDPFEVLAYSSPDPDIRRHIGQFKKSAARKFGFICFSTSFKSPVQWGHYANKHRGICLGFDISSCELHDIQYRSGRIVFDFTKYVDMTKAERISMMRKLLAIKHSQWRYEKESRLILDLDDCTPQQDGLYFKDFKSFGKLKQVIVGCNSEITRADIATKIDLQSEHIECFKVRAAFNTYNIVKNRNNSLWS